MIRVGIGKPSIRFIPAWNDMGSFFPSEYDVNDWFIMSTSEYMEKTEYERFNMNGMSKHEADLVAKMMGTPDSMEFNPFDHPHSCEMQRLIKKAGGLLWPFNAYNKNLDGYIRQIAVMGEHRLTQWSWYDCYVKLPILNLMKDLLNKTLVHRRAKELAEWREFHGNV